MWKARVLRLHILTHARRSHRRLHARPSLHAMPCAPARPRLPSSRCAVARCTRGRSQGAFLIGALCRVALLEGPSHVVPLLRVCLRFADLGAAAVPCRRRPRHAMRRTSARPSAMRWSGMQQRRDPEGFSKQKSAVEGKSVRKARRSIIGNLGHVVTKRASTLVGSTLGISVGELRSMRERSWRCSRLWRSGLQRAWCGRECGGELRFSRVR